ncbi:MAG: hypothetical protein IJA65_05570 [Acholeplasmatales bacterium]|nr:hypothetical protein [Acholeplasmatales bacterium]
MYLSKKIIYDNDESINPTYNPKKHFNIVRNTCIRADKRYNSEVSKEIFLVQPHDNDLYIQN